MNNLPTIIGTGLSGMVGSRLVELFNHKYRFVNLDLTTNVDITKQVLVEKALSSHPPATVIHLAAFTDVSKAYQEKGDKNGLVYKLNTLATSYISKACAKYNHYLIHVSTDFVFDGTKKSEYTELDKPNPIEWYGQTKYWAEQEVLKSKAKYIITRLAFPYRAEYKVKPDLVRNILDKLKSDSLYPMFADQIITPTFIDDFCKALEVFIQKQPTGIYHTVGSTSISPYDLAKKIAKVFNLKAKITPGSFKDFLKKDPRPRHRYLTISNQKFKKEFNLSMSDIDSGLKLLKDQLDAS